jgi:hypothetical protein
VYIGDYGWVCFCDILDDPIVSVLAQLGGNGMSECYLLTTFYVFMVPGDAVTFVGVVRNDQ